jgi:hypothetical protein
MKSTISPSGHHQLLHGALRGDGTRQGCSQAPLLVPLRGWHFRHMATGPDRLRDFTWLPEQCPPEHSVQRGDGKRRHLSFLDIDIYRRSDVSLGHKVYCKPTHNILYLNSSSHHYSSNKHAVLFTLVHGARALCDQDSRHAQFVFLRNIFRKNGYVERADSQGPQPSPEGCPARRKDGFSRLPALCRVDI